MTPSDPLYGQQWHFTLIGDIETIWDEFTGAEVAVAVYDEGVQYAHPDLDANYDATRHFTYNDFTYDGGPIYSRHAHGTAVAGLIAAEAGNDIGGVGVAFGVTLSSQNFLDVTQYELDDTPEEAAAFQWAAGFAIMNNSWGSEPLYEPFQSLADPFSDRARLDGYYASLVETGRNGRGTVIVQAAGNDTLNANGDGLNASRFTVTVAATEATGVAATYSNYGVNILVAAPAAAVTTDMLGNAGYNTATDDDLLDPGYTGTYNGTSAATPVVAGVVALMLEAAPDLGWRDVANILAMSAAHTGSAIGSSGGIDEIGYWATANSGNQWNGGSNGYHLNYGFGMVDAFAATRMAEAWLTMQGVARTSANELVRNLFSPTSVSALPDYDPVTGNGTLLWTRTMAQGLEIETVYVMVDITHDYAEDLILTLIAPDGSEVPLMYQEGGDYLMDSGLRWTFAVEALRGMSSLGDWTLKVEDAFEFAAGTISDFDLQFFGAAASNRDIYHFTDDHLGYQAVEAFRAVIDDANGGLDWLNFSAIAGDIVGSLAAGSTITVAGVDWVTLSGRFNAFDRIYAGDGDDALTGNSGANMMHGARGNDTLTGGNGNDVLDGGQGADRLLGGKNDDILRGGAGDDYLDAGGQNDTLSGGGGADTFVFALNYARDMITDFADDSDLLRLNDNLWTGVLSVQQVITTFATNLAGGGVKFDFGAAELTLTGLSDRQLLIDDIVIF